MKPMLQQVHEQVEPYPYPVSHKGEYHFRSGSTKQELKGAALDKFLLRRQGRTWDGVPVPRVGIRDLSRPAIDTFRKLARQSRRLDTAVLWEKPHGLIEKLHLLDGKYLERAAVLLFHSDPEHFVTGAFVKIGYFRTNVDLLYHDEIHGDLFTQVSSTMDLLLTKYLKAGISRNPGELPQDWTVARLKAKHPYRRKRFAQCHDPTSRFDRRGRTRWPGQD
jgi:ATP-dependent DNA helicase RecG